MSDVDVVVGRIGKPHGLRGEVTVDVKTDEPERRFAAGAVLTAEAPAGSAYDARVLTVENIRRQQRIWVVRFAEIGDRTAAEAARGVLLHTTIARDELPADPEEFYDHQLVGLAAVDLDGRALGEVCQVLHPGAQDLLVIATPEGRQALVPFVAALVPTVDLPAGRVVIADRPGLVTPFEDEN